MSVEVTREKCLKIDDEGLPGCLYVCRNDAGDLRAKHTDHDSRRFDEQLISMWREQSTAEVTAVRRSETPFADTDLKAGDSSEADR